MPKSSKSVQDLHERRDLRRSVGERIVDGDKYAQRYMKIQSSRVPFLADEPKRANPLEYKYLKPITKIPYCTKTDFDRRVYGEIAEKPIRVKGIFSKVCTFKTNSIFIV